jgi:uncharacterized membrane protein
MELPAITLPQIALPFDIPVLLHPAVVHFAVAVPVVILLLEFYNLFAKRKSIGGFSFILLILTIVVFAVAYLTGSVDGKEAYDLLSPEGQEELKEHKLLGIYLLIGTVIVLFFKLLAMTKKGFLKFFYFLTLIGLILITFKQGKDGGELVYEYGANIEKVKTLDDELFDAKEALDDLNTTNVASTVVATPKIEENKEVATEVTKEVVEAPVVTPEERDRTDKLLESAAQEMKEASQKVLSSVKEEATEAVKSIVPEVVPSNP